ncbi:hypothetical protein PVAND_006191 [Polypedilum vanderplanki]|uniref:Methyltransferase domain-containing protein n=1 Tax=Polypedilum vanderplanki TaxID=319348 RepID=A0A9J6C380_POLVA|nr:hypothetical protein PVAND_006191 [Polypedilum vanderplanki]
MILKVQHNLDRIINHLEPVKEFANIHMVAWLCDNLYEKFVDEKIRNEINGFNDVNSAIQLFFNQDNAPPNLIKKHPNLYKHILHEKTFYLENLEDKLYLTADELMQEFQRINIPKAESLNINVREFMKEKKNHEVEAAAKIIGTMSKSRDQEKLIVVEYGDGKGYLTTRLSLEYNLKTLGIDGNVNNTLEAEIRNEKLTKIWKHLVKKGAERSNVKSPIIDETKLNPNNYKTISSLIYADTNLNKLVENAFPDQDISELCLIGLHACGNLSSNSLKHFVSNDKIKLLMNVSCCYNLLFEEFTIDYFNNKERKIDKENDYGFPLSDFLRKKKYSIGRNARMLATQSMERIVHQVNRPDESLYHRAIFEKVLRERFRKGKEIHVFTLGKIRRVKNLEDYLRRACERLEITYDLTPEELEKLEKEHLYDKELMTFHYFVRLLYARTIETIIHLDRYLYLLENNIKHVYLVRIFDSVISPRNLAIVGIKD